MKEGGGVNGAFTGTIVKAWQMPLSDDSLALPRAVLWL
jgi:hypothetical protein